MKRRICATETCRAEFYVQPQRGMQKYCPACKERRDHPKRKLRGKVLFAAKRSAEIIVHPNQQTRVIDGTFRIDNGVVVQTDGHRHDGIYFQRER